MGGKVSHPHPASVGPRAQLRFPPLPAMHQKARQRRPIAADCPPLFGGPVQRDIHAFQTGTVSCAILLCLSCPGMSSATIRKKQSGCHPFTLRSSSRGAGYRSVGNQILLSSTLLSTRSSAAAFSAAVCSILELLPTSRLAPYCIPCSTRGLVFCLDVGLFKIF